MATKKSRLSTSPRPPKKKTEDLAATADSLLAALGVRVEQVELPPPTEGQLAHARAAAGVTDIELPSPEEFTKATRRLSERKAERDRQKSAAAAAVASSAEPKPRRTKAAAVSSESKPEKDKRTPAERKIDEGLAELKRQGAEITARIEWRKKHRVLALGQDIARVCSYLGENLMKTCNPVGLALGLMIFFGALILAGCVDKDKAEGEVQRAQVIKTEQGARLVLVTDAGHEVDVQFPGQNIKLSTEEQDKQEALALAIAKQEAVVEFYKAQQAALERALEERKDILAHTTAAAKKAVDDMTQKAVARAIQEHNDNVVNAAKKAVEATNVKNVH